MSREYSLPATTREAVWTGAPPGRAPGQITLTVRDASDNTLFLAATNAVETSVPGTYRVTYATPQVAGLLLETWTDTVPVPDMVRTYELEITSNAPQSPIFTPPTGQYVRSFFFNMPESTIAFVRATMQEAAVTADLTLPGSWASIELFDPLPAPETDGSYELTTDNAVVDPTAYYRIAWETALGAVFYSDAVLFPGSAGGLCTLEQVRRRRQTKPDDTIQDDLVLDVIDEASLELQRYCAREFVDAGTQTRTLAYYGRDHVELIPYDLRGVSTVTIGPSGTVLAEGAGYRLGQQTRDGTYRRIYLDALPDDALTDMGGPILIEITGQWGFERIPADVTGAGILTVVHNMRTTVGQYSVANEAGGTSRFERVRIPQAAKDILRTYCRQSTELH